MIIIKKVFYLAIILIVGMFVLPLSLFATNIIYNNVVLNIYEYKINKIPLPEEFEIISKDKLVGNFYGSGDNIDFMVYYIVKTDMTEQEIEDYYKSVYVPPAKIYRDKSGVIVNEQPDNIYIDVPEDCVLIIFIDESYPSLLDIRGC